VIPTMARPLFLVAVLPLLIGCMKMGPDYRRPDTGIQIPPSFQYAETAGLSGSGGSQDDWWRVFHDPELDRLVQEALNHNLDIRQASARILEVRSQLVQTRADRYPTLSVQGGAERQRTPQTVSVPGVSVDRESSNFSLSLPATFEMDLWGRLARAEEAAKANLLQAEENRRTVAQSIVAETMTVYFQTESLERQIQIIQQSVESYRRSLALVEKRYERGLTSILDVRQARRILAQAEAGLPELLQELGIAQQNLAVLLGRYPETHKPRSQPEDYYRMLAPVPPGLPSQLLLQRPDVRAAEANLVLLNAQVGVAKASRFPLITLTGNFGYSSEDLDRLFRPESELWNLALGIVQPIFDAGKLKAGQRAAEARYQQGVAGYAKTLLVAFSEVERALLTRKEQLERRDRVLGFLTEARATQSVAENRYLRGLVDYLTVLDAQQTRFQAEVNLVLVDLAIMTNRVSLHRALGGGWAQPPAEGPNSVRQG